VIHRPVVRLAGALVATIATAACGASSSPTTSTPPTVTTSPSASSSVQIGEGIFRLELSRLHVNVMVVQGTTDAAMQAGAGHYLATPLPGAIGNVAVLGDAKFYGRPFQRLADAKPGDRVVTLTRDGASHEYQAIAPFNHHSNPWTVSRIDASVIGQGGSLGAGHWLTLITKPRGNAPIVVLRLRLVS
jgi:hypothetical protein